jgi:hypothetical protein
MGIRVLERHAMTLALVALAGCDDKDKQVTAEPVVAPSASVVAENEEPPAAGCKASGDKPVELGSTIGFVYGFATDATDVYYTSWDIYGNRGDLGRVRKDGGGRRALASLPLEPRGLRVDGENIYFTSGIRLMKLAKQGESPSVFAEKFSSQGIALDATHVYGVPGDYGPYDRVVKLAKKGGVTWELDVATRPEREPGPNGYTGIAVDADGIYVTDSGNDRVLKFPLERGKPKILVSRQPKAYDLAIDPTNVYFTQARAGNLMKVAKTGGQAVKLASGLVKESRIAADEAAVFMTLAGDSEEVPLRLSKLLLPDGKPTTIALVPNSQTVEAIALDGDCVYWAQRDIASKKATVYALARR